MSRPILKRKIGFYTSSDCYGGLEKNALHFIEWLIGKNNEVVLLSPVENQISKVAGDRKIPRIFPQKSKSYISLKKAYRLSRILHNQKFEYLFILRPRDILLAAVTKILFCGKIRLIYFQQSILRLKKHPWLYSFIFRPYDAWITPSTYLRDMAIQMVRYKPSRLYVIPPCIDVEYYKKSTLTSNAARNLLGLPADRIILGSIGRYDLRRKHDFLIRCIQLLHRYNFMVDLMIMGKTSGKEDEEYFQFLQELAKECQVEEYIHFRTYTDKIITFFKAVNIFIMNWAGEPYDLLLIKAMASGTPVIARFSDYNNEILENGKYGLQYEDDDIEDLSSKIIHLLTQKLLAQHLKNESAKIVSEKYDKQVGCKQVDELLNLLT